MLISQERLPAIVVFVAPAPLDVVVALEQDATDTMVMPVSSEEYLAPIHAIIRCLTWYQEPIGGEHQCCGAAGSRPK